jgi:hypothetical protein
MKKAFLTILILFSFFKGKAQNADEFKSLIPVSTVSPNSASLGKFGNIPVSYATGIPSVAIPLYEINAGKIKLPLSLDYHGGGVRVDEISSSVGTSWALSGIPEITRNMVGLPDEASGGYLSGFSRDSIFNYYSGYSYGTATDARFAQFMFNVRDNLADTEPDVFSYSLNGSSGKFIYRADGTILQIPVTNNRIEKLSGNAFRITDPAGFTYLFDQRETTQIISGSGFPYTSTWKVSKIVDPTLADTVYFKYTGSSGTIERSWSYSYTLGNKPSGNEEQAPTSLVDATGENSSVSQTSHASLFPNEIDWRGGKVTFKNTQDRTDRSTELRLDSVKVYSKLNGTFQLVRNAKLNQSYFYSNPVTGMTPDYRNYRLRLDSVSFFPVNAALPPQKYSMTYNNTPIAPNESFGQDIWGFNNGNYNNPTLMPRQTVSWKGSYPVIGEANMDPDSTNTFVEACMLQSIKYPTKGTSVFAFEPHRYPIDYQGTQQQSVYCDAYGSVQSSNTISFTVTASQLSFRYSATLSAYNYPGVTDRPQIKMVDQATGEVMFLVNNVSNPSQSYSVSNVGLSLTVGHTYVITTNIYTADSRVQATCAVSWNVPVSGTRIKTGGGLRVSSITNYDNNGSFINKEKYQYNNDGVGKLLTNASYLAVNYDYLFYSIGFTSSFYVDCAEAVGDVDVIYHAKSVFPATQFSGSPVLYNGVTKYDVDASDNPNGKTVYGYQIFDDQAGIPSTDYGSIGIWLISNSWKNGFMNQEYVFKSNGSAYSPVSMKNFNYQIYRQDTLLGLKIKPTYIKMSGGCEFVNSTNTKSGPANDPNGSSHTHFFMGRVPTYTGAMLLQTESDTTFDVAGNKVVTVHNSYYDDLTHIFPTRKETFNSRGDNLTDVIKYPHDLASGTNVYQTMLGRNMVSPVVKFQQLKNGSQLALANINYNDWFGNGNLLQPQSVDEQVLSNPVETRTKFNKYDSYGNILAQQKSSGPVLSYQWGYYSQYPVAQATNASWNDIFYESFEEGNGNSTDDKTGHYGHAGVYTKALSGLDAGSYTLTYWQKSGSVWSLISTQATVTGSTYTIGASPAINGQIDDVRFYPSAALVTTYTYDPLVGMTSATDAKSQVTYFEYDGFQRLINIKDKDGYIIKHTDYHYQGQ